MAKIDKRVEILLRYLIILVAGLGNLFIFYKIFTPLTTYLSAFILNLFSKIIIIEGIIIFNSTPIKLIPACVAGAAYYLLFILIFSTPKIKLKKRIKILLFSFSLLFILNVLRIVILALINQSVYFESIHLVFWYGVSTLFVVGVWIASVKVFKIKEIPVYSDFKFLLGALRKPAKKSKRRK